MKTTFKKTVSALLAVLMIVCILPVSSYAGATNDQLYISSVALAYSRKNQSNAKKYLTDVGYTPVGIDFNYGVFGDYVFMGVKYSENPDEAIRAFRIYVGDAIKDKGDPEDVMISNVNGKSVTFYKVGAGAVDYLPSDADGVVELNRGAGGEYLYLYATRDKNAGQPISEITMTHDSDYTNADPYLAGYYHATSFQNTDIPQDCNDGTGGEYLFLHWLAEDKTVPDGYWFKRDSYGFENYGTYIEKKFFYTMYGRQVGYSLWSKRHNQSGLCFGMTYTTASILDSKPSSDNIREEFSAHNSSIKIGQSKISINDYIKFAHIYQLGEQFALGTIWTDAKTIYNEVKKCLDEDKIGITIGMTLKDGSAGHRVLAVGIAGNDILIDDPNNFRNLERLHINEDGTWSFTGLTGWNNTNCRLRISTDFTQPYWYLQNIDLNDWYEVAKTIISKNALLTVKDDNVNIGTGDLVEIMSEANGESEQSTAKQYWLLSDKSVTVSSTANGSNEFSLAGNEFIVGASVSDNSEVTLTADEKNDVKIKSVSGNSYSVSFIGFGEKCEALKTEIKGIADGSEIIAEKTENGVTVKGLNDISVVYSKDDVEIGNATAKVKDGGEVNITVDKDTGNVQTDFVGEKTENACGYCGKVHGTSFKEVLVKFFHKIFYFFAKLFGTIK